MAQDETIAEKLLDLASNLKGLEYASSIDWLIKAANLITNTPIDYPDADGTDDAHPAWWRGHQQAALVFCQLMNEILDGKDDGRGFNYEPWHSTRRRLIEVSKLNVRTPEGGFKKLFQVEKMICEAAVEHYRGNKSVAAERLGIGRSSLYRKLRT